MQRRTGKGSGTLELSGERRLAGSRLEGRSGRLVEHVLLVTTKRVVYGISIPPGALLAFLMPYC